MFKRPNDDSPAPDRMPVLKISVTLTETGDTFDTLYTDASWFDVREALQKNLEVFETETEMDEAREGNCNG